ncbi:MAG: rRNA maturation RNase YbeY [Paludibacteraceae bacterium]|nr:rRNA maturation RNase YbeY [Paludibacteraceae bacterium]
MINFIYDSSLASERITLIDGQSPRLQRWLRQVAAHYGFRVGELTYIFCTDEKELAVNREFLGHDYYTDVITFDYSTPQCVSGDVFISWEMIRSNATDAGVSAENELLRILAHGLLHLTGQGDKTPETKAEMTHKEEHALSLYG